jgi:hypothetical protein
MEPRNITAKMSIPILLIILFSSCHKK